MSKDESKGEISMGQNGEVKAKAPNPQGSLFQVPSPIVHKSKGHNESLKQKFNLAGSHHLFRKVRNIPFTSLMHRFI